MSNKTWKIPDTLSMSFSSRYSALASGATLVHPQYYFPNELTTLGINSRDAKRNDLWGTVVTRPSNNELVFGVVYLDKKDNQVDEDIYVVNLLKKLLEYHSKGKYEQQNPLYKETHKGIKDFLKP